MRENKSTIEEFIRWRCEDFYTNDKKFQSMNKLILDVEKKLRGLLTDEQAKVFNEYETLVMSSNVYAGEALYWMGYRDKIYGLR